MNTITKNAIIVIAIAAMPLLFTYQSFAASDAVINPKWWDRYVKIKTIAANYPTSNDNLNVFWRGKREGSYTDDLISGVSIHICDTPSIAIGVLPSEKGSDRDLFDIAGTVLYWKLLFNEARIPEDAWGPPLQDVEKAMIVQMVPKAAQSGSGTGVVPIKADSDIFEQAEKYLVKYLAADRARHHRRVPKITDEHGCGAGGPVDVHFRTSPPGGHINIISEFSYKACQLDGTQDDIAKCTNWRRAKQTESVSGYYYVFGVWGDDAIKPYRVNLNDVHPGETITVSK
jgi:hypothetical protein